MKGYKPIFKTGYQLQKMSLCIWGLELENTFQQPANQYHH